MINFLNFLSKPMMQSANDPTRQEEESSNTLFVLSALGAIAAVGAAYYIGNRIVESYSPTELAVRRLREAGILTPENRAAIMNNPNLASAIELLSLNQSLTQENLNILMANQEKNVALIARAIIRLNEVGILFNPEILQECGRAEKIANAILDLDTNGILNMDTFQAIMNFPKYPYIEANVGKHAQAVAQAIILINRTGILNQNHLNELWDYHGSLTYLRKENSDAVFYLNHSGFLNENILNAMMANDNGKACWMSRTIKCFHDANILNENTLDALTAYNKGGLYYIYLGSAHLHGAGILNENTLNVLIAYDGANISDLAAGIYELKSAGILNENNLNAIMANGGANANHIVEAILLLSQQYLLNKNNFKALINGDADRPLTIVEKLRNLQQCTQEQFDQIINEIENSELFTDADKAL